VPIEAIRELMEVVRVPIEAVGGVPIEAVESVRVCRSVRSGSYI
jgi:hypothetical protein